MRKRELHRRILSRAKEAKAKGYSATAYRLSKQANIVKALIWETANAKES